MSSLKRFSTFWFLVILILFGLWLPANAAEPRQTTIPTPTPGPDGRIIYIVQPGDNCIRVAAIHLITVEQLRQLNSRLDENCTLVAGQELLIGIVPLATEEPGVTPTPSEPTVTPTPFTGTTEICVLLYNDANGNAFREADEGAVAGGAVSVTEVNGKYSATQDTVAPPADPEAYQGICFTNVPEGTYNITVGIPPNYNPTIDLNYSLEVAAGDRAFVDFGVQSKDVVADTGPRDAAETGRSSVLGIVGALFLFAGAGLGYFAWRSSRPESRLSNRGGGYLPRR